jgi:putative ABC transport system permease protein
MRRLLGASRVQIIGQIVFESIISVLISLVIALGWVYLFVLLIPIEDLIGRPIDLIGLFVLDNLLYWVPGILIIALLSSLYPAYLFSKANIVEMDNRRKTAQTFTNIMIGVQFVASFMVISSMFLMKSQLNMLLNFDLGITEEQIVSIELGNRSTNDEVQLLRTQLSNEPGVLEVTDAIIQQNNLIGTYNINTELENADGSRIETVFSAGFVGFDFCEVFGIEVIEGRDFRPGQLERQSVLVNEKFADEFYQGDAIGKPIHFRNVLYTIIGVVENFHYHSLRDELQALAIFPRGVFNDGLDVPIETSFQIRIDQVNQNHTLDHIKDLFADHYPNYPFGYKYVSDKISAFYEEDQNDASLTAILGFSAIFIAIFGLVGLVSFEINQRLRELSIRKVLGADPKSLFYTITKKQLFVLLLTCLISVPATYLFIRDWLNEFSVSINLSISILIATIATFIIVLLLVLAAMTFKFIEIMRINPSESLRHE